MKPILTLPCKNRHSEMEKQEKGFHCKSCDHILTDFRNSTEEEIQSKLQKNQGKICGVFNSDQVDYKISQIQIPAFRAVGLSLLGILGFLGPVVTSCENDPAATTEHKQNAFNLLKFPLHVKGSVKDEKTGNPLPLFKVELLQHGKLIKTIRTDDKGNFDVLIYKNDLDQEVFKLAIGGQSYKRDTVISNITKFGGNSKVRLTIKAEPQTIVQIEGKTEKICEGSGENIYPVDGYVAPPLPEVHVTAGIPMDILEAPEEMTPDHEEPEMVKPESPAPIVTPYKPGKTRKIKANKDTKHQ